MDPRAPHDGANPRRTKSHGTKSHGAENDDSKNDDTRSYALYLRLPDRSSFWGMKDQGITLTRDSISWSVDGQDVVAPLTDIAEVHLQTGAIGGDKIASCRLRFADWSQISILSCDSRGGGDTTAAQAELYSDFVHDLHARLAALTGASIAFTAGFSEARYQFGKVLVAVVVGFFVVMPTVLVLITGQLKALAVLNGGVVLAWPVYQVVTANAPRNYDPDNLPEELVRTRSALRNWLSWIQN
jgi:hypothetical protein